MIGEHTPLQAEMARKQIIVEAGVNTFSQGLRTEAEAEHPHVCTAIEAYLSLLERGGKRTRGMLALTGYEMYGGDIPRVAETTAGIVEAMHAYLLVVDDVADAATLRRNGPTAHIFIGEYLRTNNLLGNTEKLGEDSAQAAALYAQHKAQAELLLLEEVPAERRIHAMHLLNEGLALTGRGQILDMLITASPDTRVEDILTVAQRKTAYYSFLLPLQLGAVLAGAPKEELMHFLPYSVNAGLAFQLRDDIIGMFGDEAQTGKSRKSDITEGKRTLLMTDALSTASEADFGVLHAALGNTNLSDGHFEECLEIIKRTGALDRTTAMIARYNAEAQASLENVPASWAPQHVQFLREVAAYGAQRNK